MHDSIHYDPILRPLGFDYVQQPVCDVCVPLYRVEVLQHRVLHLISLLLKVEFDVAGHVVTGKPYCLCLLQIPVLRT